MIAPLHFGKQASPKPESVKQKRDNISDIEMATLQSAAQSSTPSEQPVLKPQPEQHTYFYFPPYPEDEFEAETESAPPLPVAKKPEVTQPSRSSLMAGFMQAPLRWLFSLRAYLLPGQSTAVKRHTTAAHALRMLLLKDQLKLN